MMPCRFASPNSPTRTLHRRIEKIKSIVEKQSLSLGLPFLLCKFIFRPSRIDETTKQSPPDEDPGQPTHETLPINPLLPYPLPPVPSVPQEPRRISATSNHHPPPHFLSLPLLRFLSLSLRAFMASLPRHHLLLLLCCFSCLVHSSRSRTLVLPLARDASTLRYVATVYHGPSLDPLELAVDLGGPSLWLDCSAPSSGSSIRRVPCRSIQCLAATSDASGLRRACPSGPSSVCGVRAEGGEAGVLGEGAVAVDSVDGSGERSVAAVDRFLISCVRAAPGFGESGVGGTLGLGRSRISLPSQVATAFGVRRRFFACLSASEGVIVAGDGPFFSHLDADISKSLTYTPLATPLATARSPRASDYLINLTSIKINGKRLPLNSSSPYLIQLSAEIPYTAVASPIYSALAEAFAGAASAMGMARVPPVAPFGACFDPRSVGATAAGPDVPAIDLVLQSEMVRWRIGGSSSMVRVSDEATCLGVVDGGDRLGSSVVLGGHQLEDVLLEFDFGGSRLGFSPSLSTMQLSCSNFRSNFNSMALSSQ